ncbi:MAG: hypothetical protein ACSHYA_18190 [Opitutaceae bacterium]
MSLPADIIVKIKTDFPNKEDYDLVESVFDNLQVNEKSRVVRCILIAASGDLKKLSHLEELATRDYRDVIVTGEYEYPSCQRIRDLSKSF